MLRAGRDSAYKKIKSNIGIEKVTALCVLSFSILPIR